MQKRNCWKRKKNETNFKENKVSLFQRDGLKMTFFIKSKHSTPEKKIAQNLVLYEL